MMNIFDKNNYNSKIIIIILIIVILIILIVIITYTKEQKNEIKTKDNTIASFYNSQELYEKQYPITINEMEQQLNIDWKTIYNKINNKLKLVINSFKDKFEKINNKWWIKWTTIMWYV